jgi:hypothetical protein
MKILTTNSAMEGTLFATPVISCFGVGFMTYQTKKKIRNSSNNLLICVFNRVRLILIKEWRIMGLCNIASSISNLGKTIKAAEELALNDKADSNAEATPEEKDKDTLLQEHVKNNIDKYKLAFEKLFPATQMVVTNLEYRGAVLKDKIRVLVEFQAPLLNFDALKVLADKEIGVEASGEKTFKVYNMYLPRIKDPTIKD